MDNNEIDVFAEMRKEQVKAKQNDRTKVGPTPKQEKPKKGRLLGEAYKERLAGR
jgi:hypothetical protein